MNQNFIRINIMLSKNRSNQSEKLSLQNEARNFEFFIFVKKRYGKDFRLDGSWFVCPWPMQKCIKVHSYIILVSNLAWDSSGLRIGSRLMFSFVFAISKVQLLVLGWVLVKWSKKKSITSSIINYKKPPPQKMYLVSECQ